MFDLADDRRLKERYDRRLTAENMRRTHYLDVDDSTWITSDEQLTDRKSTTAAAEVSGS